MEYLLGIDIGTSGTKTVLFDKCGKAIASETFEYIMYQPHEGWAEQTPNDWFEAVVKGISFVIKKSGISKLDIKGVGLSGQMHGLVMLDKEGNVIRDSIIWCDQRTSFECMQMNELIGEKRLIEITANPALTGFTASKILWVKNNEPDNYNKCAHILLPKDYIRYKLTGDFATEVSDASGMQLMDIGNRCWSTEVLEKLDIDIKLLPKMHESQDVTGVISEEAANMTGLLAGTIVVGGAGDNAAAAIGVGVIKEGRAFTTIGTSGVVYAVSDTVAIDLKGRVHTLCASVPNKWTLMSCTQGAGLSLKWVRDNFCQAEKEEAKRLGIDVYDIMSEMADKSGIGAGGLIYLPYLCGERSPHPDPDCRGVFFGLSSMHDKGNIIRAVMEGVSYSQLECVSVFREMGVLIDDMYACGGGGRSKFWRQMLSDLYQCNVSLLHADEGGALGVAILAGVGCGIYKSIEEGCDLIVKRKTTDCPQDNFSKYKGYYELYKKLYCDLYTDFKLLAGLKQNK